MKKILSICIIFIITLSQLSYVNIAYAANYTAEEVADLILYDIDKEQATFRKIDALIAVMNAMGWSNYDALTYSPYSTNSSDWADSRDVLPWDRELWHGYVYVARPFLLFGEEVLLEDGSVGTYCDVRHGGKSCVKSIKTNLLGENYGRNNFYQGGFST